VLRKYSRYLLLHLWRINFQTLNIFFKLEVGITQKPDVKKSKSRFEISMKSYLRNTINNSYDKKNIFLLASVIDSFDLLSR